MRKTILLATILTTFVSSQDRSPLAEFRAHFLNQRIAINQDFSSLQMPFLGNWRFVKEKKGRDKGIYEPNYSKNVPAAFVGRSGIIIAVQAPLALPFERPAAQADDTYVKYAEAIVKLDSGELVQTAVYDVATGTQVHDAFTLISVKDKHKEEAKALAQKLAGKSLYLTNLTKLYDMGLTTGSIQTIKAGVGYSEAQMLDVPLLTPIPIVETRYSEQLDFSLVVLKLPNGRKALYVPGCVADESTVKNYNCASTSMPSFLTDREAEAIRKGKVFIGMSEPAVYMTMGFPKNTNKAVVGLTQLVYHSAYIYLDENKNVAEIQSHE